MIKKETEYTNVPLKTLKIKNTLVHGFEDVQEYVSKMNFYLEALDREYKMPNENPSIGIILCTDVNKTIVEYATARTVSPAYIATYSTKLIDEELLKRKLNEYQRIFKK